ncbi:MAG: hypothetical protein LKK19_00210 [Bacteroidales bacterium]|jgi:hypothetical protein|nr:hypothetical protein [Bacteroidales bacterium]MCI2121116.1 hypothetical protein [Bacteroidales bacterium]MCI2144931.1 hypothetical protein [Bacteroidales bacterium]
MKLTAIIRSWMGVYYSIPKDPVPGKGNGIMTQSASIAEAKQNFKKVMHGDDAEYEFLYDLSCLRCFFEMVDLEIFASMAGIPYPELRDFISGERFASNSQRIRVIHTLQKIGLRLAEARY